MQIITYPHPTLRYVAKPIRRVDAELRQIVSEMFTLMYQAKGVGLAAPQVDLPLRLFVVNAAGKPGEGEELVFLNPELSSPKGSSEKEEGCLSLPELYGDVVRPERIHVQAYNLSGEQIDADLSGLMSRVVQHEFDHLNGVLFIDRLSTTGKMEAAAELEDFAIEFNSRRATGGIPSDDVLAQQRAEWERKYC